MESSRRALPHCTSRFSHGFSWYQLGRQPNHPCAADKWKGGHAGHDMHHQASCSRSISLFMHYCASRSCRSVKNAVPAASFCAAKSLTPWFQLLSGRTECQKQYWYEYRYLTATTTLRGMFHEKPTFATAWLQPVIYQCIKKMELFDYYNPRTK